MSEIETAVTHYCIDCKRPVHRSHRTFLEFKHHRTFPFGRLFPKAEHKARIAQMPRIRPLLRAQPIPAEFDLRNVNGVNFCPPVGDQGQEGSCPGWGAYGMMGVLERLNNTWDEDFSPRFIYNDARYREGNLSGEGAYLVDVMAGLEQDGICRWHYWPYTDNFDNRWPCPRADGMVDALNWKIGTAVDLSQDPNPIEAVQLCMMQIGAPDFGTPWTESWMNAWLTGTMPLPTADDLVVGGHSWFPVAWRTDSSGNLIFTGQNSWGPTNILGGYFDFPAPTLDMSVNTCWANAGGWEGYQCTYVLAHVCPTGQYWDPTQSLCVPDNPAPSPDPVSELIQCLEANFPNPLPMVICIENFLREEHIITNAVHTARLEALKRRVPR